MRNPVHLLMRSALPAARAAAVAVLPVALIVAGAGSASAAETTRAESTNMAFGLLGPVGLIAVALGIVGMAFGVLRQRRKARAVPAPAQPATPDVPAMAQAVLAEEDALTRPQRP